MLFSSVSFLIFFLPCLFIVYFTIPKKFRDARNKVLLLFSLGFYAYGGPKYLLLMLASITINYVGGLLTQGRNKKLGVIFSVFFGLTLLIWFKYAGFLSEIIAGFFPGAPLLQITLPIGISFYTFQGLSYVIDVYRGDTPVQKNPLKLALYISLFPQLIAGPIVRYSTIANEIDNRQETLSDFAEGVTRFMLGFGKKMILANAAAEIADAAFALSGDELTVLSAWLGALAYTAQIYFDFSAYSDMAIGLGRILGFHFLENFNHPYIARSVRDFWRRWHISLSSFFRDYVYIPLGGNRHGILRHIRNVSVVWILTGLWHGAAWNFVFWGIWYLFFLLGESYLWGKGLDRAPRVVGHIYAMLIITFGWVLFRANDLSSALSYAGAMLGLTDAGLYNGQSIYFILQYLPEWLLFIPACLPLARICQKELAARPDSKLCVFILHAVPPIFALAVFAIGYVKLVTGSFNPFIYFRF